VTALNLADDDEGMSDPTALAIWGYGPRHELQSGILQTGKVNQYRYKKGSSFNDESKQVHCTMIMILTMVKECIFTNHLFIIQLF